MKVLISCIIFVISFSLYTPQVSAESSDNQPLGPSISSPASLSSLNQYFTSTILPQASTTGRSSNDFLASNQANMGSQTATLTGMGYLASGLPMLPSIIPEVHATGVMLVSKAAQEFAQAMADNSSGSQNNAQGNYINSPDGSGASVGNDNAFASNLANQVASLPALQSYAESQGMSPTELANALTNGSNLTPDSINTLLNQNGSSSGTTNSQNASASDVSSLTTLPTMPTTNASSALTVAQNGSNSSTNAASGAGGMGMMGGLYPGFNQFGSSTNASAKEGSSSTQASNSTHKNLLTSEDSKNVSYLSSSQETSNKKTITPSMDMNNLFSSLSNTNAPQSIEATQVSSLKEKNQALSNPLLLHQGVVSEGIGVHTVFQMAHRWYVVFGTEGTIPRHVEKKLLSKK